MDRQRLLDWLFPRKCPFCGRVSGSDLPCEDCQTTLPWLTGAAAVSHVEFTEVTVSALAYRGKVRNAVRGMKFGKKLSRAKPLGVLIAQCVADHLSGPFDFVSYPPLSAKHLRQRGFDQGELLAQEVAASMGKQVSSLFVKENRPAQSLLVDTAERKANILGAYRLRDAAAVVGKDVLLVDDVVTSGATLSECAHVLLAAGARRVCAVTLARGGMYDERNDKTDSEHRKARGK